MNVEVEVPDLGTDNEQGTVVEWHFDEGEFVETGEVLLEVSTESGTVEVTAPQAGVLLERIVDEDEIVRVGEPVALLDCSEEDEETEDEPDVDELDLSSP